MIRKSLLVLLCCFQFLIQAQTSYSDKALTGRGDLELVGKTHKLQKKVYTAFEQMKKAALKDGIKINIVSAYRSFERQKSIWNRKYTTYLKQGYSSKKAIEKIIEYSTIPGTSRHHWGTDIDIVEGGKKHPKNVLNENNFNKNGVYSNLKKWMDNNAAKYGFYLVYNSEANRKGFKYEPWHYTYKAISKPMLQEFLNLDVSIILNRSKLKGYKYITPQFLKKYEKENILDINPVCFN